MRAILSPETAQEENDRAWREIEAHRPAEGLEAVDDDELEAVSGGADRDYLKDGCSSSTNDSWCWVSDNCTKMWTTYSNYDPCPKGGNHEWKAKVRADGIRWEKKKLYICQKCKAEKEADYTTDRWMNY